MPKLVTYLLLSFICSLSAAELNALEKFKIDMKLDDAYARTEGNQVILGTVCFVAVFFLRFLKFSQFFRAFGANYTPQNFSRLRRDYLLL